MIKKFNFNYKNKKFIMKIKECNNFFSKIFGLMFRKNSKPLLFNFKRPIRISIHSFFCRPFIVIWFLNKRVVDIKRIDSYKISIKPKNEFDKILEIPSNYKEFYILSDFIDDSRKI